MNDLGLHTPARRILARVALSAVLTLALTASMASAAPPPPSDFTGVSDVLQGHRRLLPVDDLVVTTPTGAGGAVSNLALLTSNSAVASQASYAVTTGSAPSFATGIGRVLNLPRDVIVTIGGGLLTVRDQNPGGQPVTASTSLSGNGVGLVMTDFNFDGFADVALLTANAPGPGGLLRIVSANDPNDVGQGFYVSTGVSPQGIDFTRPIGMATGNFFGDGTRQIVLAQPTTAGGSQFVVQVYRVAVNKNGTFPPQALSLAASGTFSSCQSQARAGGGTDAPPCLLSLTVLAGNFTAAITPTGGLPQDQFVVVAQAGSNLTIQSFTMQTSPTTAIVPVGTFTALDQLATSGQFLNPVTAIAAPLDWFSGASQVIIAYTAITNSVLTNPVNVFVSDSQLNWSQASPGGFESDVGPVAAMAAGNYDRAIGLGNPPNLELAVVTFASFGSSFLLFVFEVDPANGYIYQRGSVTPILPGVPAGFNTPMALAAGDLQGRSMLLGPPNKVTITQHKQPEVVIGAPPMHVDWVTPVGASGPTAFNVTGVPHGFIASYQTMITGQNQSSSTSTTSFSYGTKQTGEVNVSFGVPEVASISASITSIAQQTHDNVVKSVFDTYSSNSFDASTQTAFDDHLWYSSKRFNVFAYPVIGQCIACADQTACAQPIESCPVGSAPLILQFSGPDSIQTNDISAADVEWYQPVHEVGQLLSYPWTIAQLQTLFPGFQGLNCGDPTCQQQAPTVLFTDSSIATQQSNWGNGTSTQQTSGTTATSSFDTTVSVSANVSAVGDFFEVGGGGSLSFEYNTSQSIATLYSGEQTLGQSTGVGIAMPGTFQNPPLYQYAWQPFIFGQAPPAGTIQSLSTNTSVTASGTLRTAYLANPLDPNAGPWWGSAYTLPDVAVNHPTRWLVTTQTGSPNQPPPANCLRIMPTSTTMDCMTFNAPIPTDVTASEFYWMKGFFITPVAANGTGPQITQATAGDLLSLQVRVYNYSLVDMTSTTVVHAQFYAQPVESGTGQFVGPSVFIGEQLLPPIPGFSGDPTGNPNWVLAGTTFDTTDYPDSYFVFWVVVWMEDGGTLVPEMPDHGLTSIPAGTLTSITQVPIQAHSNNVGYYRQTFYVQAPSAARPTPEPDQLEIQNVSLLPAKVDPSGQVKVRAAVKALGKSADGVTVFFYDGIPGAGGRLFDVETIPHIRRDSAYLTQVLYRPTSCGGHTVVVVAQPGSGPSVSSSAPLQVGGCAVSTLSGSATRVGDGSDGGQVKVTGRLALSTASSLNLGAAQVTLQSLLAEAHGAGELVDRVAAGGVRLTAHPGGKPTSAIFESQPSSARPSFRMEIKQSAPQLLDFTLQVSRAVLSRDPELCSPGKTSSTTLTTSFVIDDGQGKPVTAATAVPWECLGKVPQSPSELRRR
jgi:hypothetical protein